MSAPIQHYFSEIIKKQKELNYPFPKFVCPPASLQSIKFVEDELDLKFNNELLELYTSADGTNSPPETPLGRTSLIPTYSLLSLADSVKYYKAYVAHPDLFKHWDTGTEPGKKLFPFLENGAGDCYWVDLNDSANKNKIYWTNTLGESPDYLFESLTKFLRVIHEGYETGVFFLDEDGYLELDDLDFAKIAQKHNPKLSYWPKFLAEG